MMRVIGIDENGYGPLLGPLVVTGTRLRFDGEPPTLEALREATGLDDSKKVFSGSSKRGEALALGVLAHLQRTTPGAAATAASSWSWPGLLNGLAVHVPFGAPPDGCGNPLYAPLGACAMTQSSIELPRWGKASTDLEAGLRTLGVTIERIAVAVVCPGVFNAAVSNGRNKAELDLHLFEAVATTLAAAPVDQVVCGKVGPTRCYAQRFSLWRDRVEDPPLEETKERSSYQIEGVGTVSFVKDADASVPAVAISSVVGKYVRELWMDGLARSIDWKGKPPSGYRDPVSKRFLTALRTAVAARSSRRRLPDSCLARIR